MKTEGARPSGPAVRGVLVKLHRHVGLAIAVFIALAGATGSVLVFQRELDAALNPDLWRVEVAGPALSPGAVAARVAAHDPRVQARWIPLEPGAGYAADVWVDWRPDPRTGAPAERLYDQMFVDPVTGRINGVRRYTNPPLTRATLIPFIHQLHSSLFLPGRIGAVLLGVVALAWAIDCFVGFYLTLPKGRALWRGWRKSWTLKRGASAERRTFDLHRAGGLWTWGLMLIMAVSGVALTLEHEVFEPAVEVFSPISAHPWEDRPSPPASAAQPVGFDPALAAAKTAARAAGVRAPTSGLFLGPEIGMYGVRFGREEHAGVGQAWVYVDSAGGEVVRTIPAAGGTAGDVVQRMQLPLHAGRVLGMPTRLLAVLVGLAAAGLSLTGVLIWANRLSARRRKQSKAKPYAAPPTTLLAPPAGQIM